MTDPALSIPTEYGRYYVHPGRRDAVPSITNIKGMKNIDGLKFWAAREAATYAADNIGKLTALDHDEVVQLVKAAPFSRSSARAESSQVGDMVHDWIDRVIKGEPAPHDEIAQAPLTARRMILQFGGFVERYRPEWIESEFSVWSDTHGYAGTADWTARINGTLVLGDTKTGKAVYPDTGMQLAALANADFILESDGTERPLPKFDRFAVLHLRPTYAKLIPVQHVDECFRAFLGLKAAFDCDRNFKDKILAYAPKIQVRAA